VVVVGGSVVVVGGSVVVVGGSVVVVGGSVDTIRRKCLKWTKILSCQLNLVPESDCFYDSRKGS